MIVDIINECDSNHHLLHLFGGSCSKSCSQPIAQLSSSMPCAWHQFPAQTIFCSMQGPCKGRRERGQFPEDCRGRPYSTDGALGLRKGKPPVVGEGFQGPANVVGVAAGIPHPHEHNVRERGHGLSVRQPEAMEHLRQDLLRRQILDEPHLASGAEDAAPIAADLGRHAESGAGQDPVGYEDALNQLFGGAAPLQELERATRRARLRDDYSLGDVLRGQALAEASPRRCREALALRHIEGAKPHTKRLPH
mmetsp:Transcript_77343/g.136403  ORF Transcript_77343/g.136403 Transcript_77343/m.136403 type:complete len:250 (+) Transcript_77343:352-1101(+)